MICLQREEQEQHYISSLNPLEVFYTLQRVQKFIDRKGKVVLTRMAGPVSFLSIFKSTSTVLVVRKIEMCVRDSNEESADDISEEGGE